MDKILIISYFANIDAMAPSHHIDDRLAVFKRGGVAVRLISSPCAKTYRSIKHTRVPSVAPSGIRYEVRYFLRRATKTRFRFKLFETILLLPVIPFYLIEKIFIRLDSTWSWFITASVAATIAAFRDRPAVIYSTGGPVSAHMAAMAASFITRVPYIAEFQDPLVHKYAAPGRFERGFMKRIERMIFKTASAAVFLTREAAKRAEARHGNGISHAIYAGTAKKDCREEYKRGTVCTLAHFGSLGGSRNLKATLTALALLFKEDPGASKRLRLELFGNNSREGKKEIKESGLEESVISHGKVRRDTAFTRMHAADVLLLIQNTDDVSFETIPSKTYEYMHTGRPVLALVYRNAELEGMLKEQGHIVVQADDVEAIKDGIKRYLELWDENRLAATTKDSPYTVERAVGELIALAGSVAK